jgi:CRP-like cAMP-binding protein
MKTPAKSATEVSARSFLAGSIWRAALSDAEFDRVERDAYLRTYQAGAIVCVRGSPTTQWIGVAEGMLKVDTESVEGKVTTFAGIPAGSWFGEGAVLKGEPRPYTVVALRDSAVVFVPSSTFLWLIDENRQFGRWVMNQLNERLGYYIALVEGFRLHEATPRIAFCLSQLFNEQLYPVTEHRLKLSQEDLARLTGTSRGQVNRSLHELEQYGLLQVRYGMIEIINLVGLQKYARG